MKENPIEELRKLLQYLKLNIDQRRLDCIRKHNSEAFHRSNKKASKRIFSKGLRLSIDESIKKANAFIYNKTGYHLPLQKYEGFIDEI